MDLSLAILLGIARSTSGLGGRFCHALGQSVQFQCNYACCALILTVGLLLLIRLASSRLTESVRKEIRESTVESLDELFRWNAYGAKALVEMLEKDLLGDGASLESFSKVSMS